MHFDPHSPLAPHPSKLNRRQLLAGLASGAALVGAGGTAGCVATNAASGRDSFTGFQSIKDDIAEGQANHPKILKAFGGAYEHARLNKYVAGIGNALAQHAEYQQYPYRFTILNTPIVNALALPGGYIYVTRGLLALASSEAELAGVLSHELAHVTARHGAESRGAQQVAQIGLLLGAIGLSAAGLPSGLMQLGQTAALAAIKGYSREHELEADTLGIRYMSRAGYDPDAMVSFLASLRAHSKVEAQLQGLPAGEVDEFNIMATHPRTVERVRQAQKLAATTKRHAEKGGRTKSGRRWGKDKYLTQIDGMMFGDDPRQGLIQGRRFVHPGLRFEFRAPKDFILRNSAKRVTGQHASGAAIVFDMSAVMRRGPAADYLEFGWAANTRLHDMERLTIDGQDAATAWAEGQNQSGPRHIRALVIRRADGRFYRFMYIAPLAQAGRWEGPFRRSGLSFRQLDAQSAARIRAQRLLVVTARPDDTVARLAKTLPFGRFNEAWFRVLNDLGPHQAINAKQRLKVIAN
ncbi:MAG: M48 family metalloprotease [Alphaproteobacteria bacterium]|nr:M48 family metalloprotease [Alphaproteobacteria bacterium]